MEDERIVLLYWDRDEAAISESSMKYGAYCTSIAQNILKNPADAEECVNDTWLHAWNAMPPHRPSLLSTFLGKITRNLSFDLYRKMHRGKRGGSQVDAVLDELEECVSGKDNIERQWEMKELVAEINFCRSCRRRNDACLSCGTGMWTVSAKSRGVWAEAKTMFQLR